MISSSDDVNSGPHAALCNLCGWRMPCEDRITAEGASVAHVIMVHPVEYEAVTGKEANGDALEQAREALGVR